MFRKTTHFLKRSKDTQAPSNLLISSWTVSNFSRFAKLTKFFTSTRLLASKIPTEHQLTRMNLGARGPCPSVGQLQVFGLHVLTDLTSTQLKEVKMVLS
jgi:hypothetical protein